LNKVFLSWTQHCKAQEAAHQMKRPQGLEEEGVHQDQEHKLNKAEANQNKNRAPGQEFLHPQL
jgi:hypothetical protein